MARTELLVALLLSIQWLVSLENHATAQGKPHEHAYTYVGTGAGSWAATPASYSLYYKLVAIVVVCGREAADCLEVL